jgi:uncharacterized repeat protein (TIGR04052 family)
VSIDFALADATGVLADPCAQPLQGLGSGQVEALLHDARFYVANLHLTSSSGADVKVALDATTEQLSRGADTIALIDLRATSGCTSGSGSGHRSITGTVPAGDYVGLRLTLGVPEALNHVDPSDSQFAPLDNPTLAWDWTSGHKHLQLELAPKSAVTGQFAQGVLSPDGSRSTLQQFHLGSTSCSAQLRNGATEYYCTGVNTRDIRLAAFDPATQRVVLDLKALLGGLDLRADAGGSAVGCMSDAADPECLPLWTALGGSAAGGQIQPLGLETPWAVTSTSAIRAAAK